MLHGFGLPLVCSGGVSFIVVSLNKLVHKPIGSLQVQPREN